MATRYAVANGNWSALATWDGGASLPGVGDDVFANGYTVTIDQDITVRKIANYASAPAVAGGKFEITANVDRILNCEINRGVTIDCLVIQSTCTTNTITINGNLYSTGNAASTIAIVLSYSSGTVNVNGDINSNPYISWGFAQRCGGGTVNIVGNIPTYVSDARAKQIIVAATINTAATVNLNFTGWTVSNQSICFDITTHCNLTINGILNGCTYTALGYGTITMNGGLNTVVINGDLNSSGINACIYVASCNAGTTITVNNSTIYGGSPFPAIYALLANCKIRLNNVTVINSDSSAIWAAHLEMIGDTNIYWQFNDGAGGNNKLYSEDNTSGVPAITDVRDGVVFGAGGGLTGTLAVPPAAAVGIGVPVDNTVGTAAITATDLQNAILGKVADGTYTIEDLLKIMAAIMAGKTTITDLGGGMATVTFRNLADTINKVVADMDHSKRTNLTIS